jgi:hypothetical protein
LNSVSLKAILRTPSGSTFRYVSSSKVISILMRNRGRVKWIQLKFINIFQTRNNCVEDSLSSLVSN